MIYIFSALSTSPSVPELIVLLIDLFQLVYFQIQILMIFRARKNSKATDLTRYRDQVYVIGSYIFKIDALVTIPMGLYLNLAFLVKLLIVFALKQSPTIFATTFSMFYVCLMIFTYRMVKKGGYFKTINLVMFIMMIETLFICLVCSA
jgi:hypothetical protein